ncbi:MAG: 2,4-dihydroxyhept-2-ene-1,7-dioic acid aldolase [Candidatus Pacebacteria bacterium]|nr:2,4-dihydroxyhept-2-ene-1,7-dioic acid aldolase [Candidatus Paceibacterota bacterium]
MAIRNPVRHALLGRTLTVGTWIQAGHAAVAEVLANVGFDWIAADCEHTDIDISAFTTLARGMHGRGCVPMARVRENDTLAIRQVLDMGAQGVIVPLIDTPAAARKAVQAAKYPPEGVRGFAFSRMNNWGVDFDEYVRTANDDIAVVAMIESSRAVDTIDDILAVDGIDGVFIGPYDMSGSYGVPGETGRPKVKEGCARVVAACERAGKSAGIHVVIPTQESVNDAVDAGFTFIGLGVDTVFLDRGARAALKCVRS